MFVDGSCALDRVNRPPTRRSIRSFYSTLDEVYADTDAWHTATKTWISRFVKRHVSRLSTFIINLGSGGQRYGLPADRLLHLDLDSKWFEDSDVGVIGDINTLPIRSDAVLACVCVGSVLNHCDAATVIAEIGRVMLPGGIAIIEFETTAGLELLFDRAFRQSAAIVSTFYGRRTLSLWAYSESYVRSLCDAGGLRVIDRSTKHHLSGLFYLLLGSRIAGHFHRLDPIVSKIPLLRSFPSHVILACEKAARRY